MKKALLFMWMLLIFDLSTTAQDVPPSKVISKSTDVVSYCSSGLGGGGFDVNSVAITGTTLNFTGSGLTSTTSDGSYYSQITAVGNNICNLEPGRSYTFTITTSYTDIISVWIDYNQNGIFESSEWTQVSTYATAGSATSCTLNIPATATTGTTGMRIRTRGYGNSNGAADACSGFGSGCTLDFSVTIANATPAVPTAAFSALSTLTTPGSSIQFYDQSVGVPTSWKWTFAGGNPSTSTSQNPLVSYQTNGTYNVKLVARNALGSDSIVKTGYITVTNAITMPVTGSRTLTTCNAIIYDNGGTSTYSNYSDGVITIYPGTAGSAVKLDFNSFSTDSYDYLYIYNGTTTAGTLLGTYSGTSIPPSATATNPAGALTLRFTSDSYTNAAGFVAQTSCANLVLQNVSAASWSASTDNNKNGYPQSKLLNYTIKNEALTTGTVYAKLYGKQSTASTYTLLSTTSSVTISASSTFSQSYFVSGLNTKGAYDFKIELYNSSNVLLNTYDLSNNTALGAQKFESVSDDALSDYVVTGLGGSSYNITGVSITGTTLSNLAARPTTTSADGSYYVEWAPVSDKTCSLTTGYIYTLNVMNTGSYSNISAWIDYNQDKVFQANEWVQVSANTNYLTSNSVSFRVPATALSGQTRMRIRSNYYYNNNAATDAATAFYSGATEDYTITIVAQPVTVPKADFSASETNVSIGTTVQYTDLTTGVPTSWKWLFPGGSPSTSTSQNPTVTYNSEGTYSATLVATNALGKDSVVKASYITVTNSTTVPASGSKSVTACGITIYDNGGIGNYANSTNGTLTIYPSTAKSAVYLKFSQFATESYCDYLYVFNGTSTSATLIGSYTGSTLPADILATNASGSLTLRFSSDGSSVYSGFIAQASCVPLNSQYINSISWTNVTDNNYNGYAQRQLLNYTVKNDNTSAVSVYTKVYCRRSGASADSLLTTGSAFTVAPSTTSGTQIYAVSGLNALDSYNFKIELYNNADSLLSTYDATTNPVLGNQKFESAANDGLPTYCSGNLGGGSFNITAVSIANSTLNNTATRATIRTLDGSYYTEFAATGSNTCSVVPGRTYTLSVTSNNYAAMGVWLDYNQDKIFQSTEYTQISSYAYSGTAYSISFTVPSTTAAGELRMRVRTGSSGFSGTDACSTFTAGCTEDYTLTVSGPATAAPQVDFSASKTTVYGGDQIQFTDLSSNIPTSWKWTFTGGTPASSTSQNPIVSYSTAGTYSVKLVATNAYGSDSIVKSSYVSVVNGVLVPLTGTTSVTACGITIYDNGAINNYSNNSNGILTINPSEAGKAVRLQFSEFNTESCDYLYVFNGTSTSATLIGTYSGSTIPNQITASNASGALTLQFYSDGSVVYSGFTAQATCVIPSQMEVKTASWTNSVDNNYNGYSQSRTLNLTAANNTSIKRSTYAKIYYKLSTASSFTLYGQTASIAVNANATSETFIYSISSLPTKGYYDFKIELYNASDSLVNTYDYNTNSILKSQGFEPVSSDGLGSYCTSGLGGSSSDITAVSVTGTTLNNTNTRSASVYTAYTATGLYTGTLTWGGINTINVTTTNNDIVSMWIDYDHNSTFDAGEWTLVTAASGAKAASASFYIPTTALTGQTRMRIRTRNAGTVNYSTDACTNFSSGCTEDYVITIDKVSDVSSVNSDGMKLYPNPVSDIVKIEIPGFTTGTATITDMLGRKVVDTQVSGDQFSLNVSNLKSGMFFVSIKAENGQIFNKQLIKK